MSDLIYESKEITYAPIIIRPATEDDVMAVHEITQAAFRKLASEPGSSPNLKALSETPEVVFNELKNKNIFVGEFNGEPVGTIRYHEPIEGIGYISRFGVHPDAQCGGMGGYLVDAVVKECRKKDLKAIALHTASTVMSSMRFYYRKNFFVVGISMDRGYYRSLMVRELKKPYTLVDYVKLFEESGL